MRWDDARLLLETARAGQMLGAARRLGVNQATLSRRISALEEAVGVSLLVRKTTGCDLTPAGERFVAALEPLADGFAKAVADLAGEDAGPSGTVRVGAPDGFGVGFLAPRLGAFTKRYPQLAVQLVPVQRDFSLSQREADIAVMVHRPQSGPLVARKLADYTLGLYATQEYLDAYGQPLEVDELSRHVLVGYVDDLIASRSLDYTREVWRDWQSQFEISSAIGQMTAVAAGAGIGILHDYLAAEKAALVPVLPEVRLRRSYWIAMHQSLRDTPRVRAVADFLVEAVGASRPAFDATDQSGSGRR